ncbi:MAG TPA: hypothetical protein VEC06_18880 [Paucimonas sp.]|nr:hypothetical protein [Paucimonas sp.]
MSGFKVPMSRKHVDQGALAAFSAGADDHSAEASLPPVAPKDQAGIGRATESLLFRLTKVDLEEFNFVFENTNVKSKQKLLEAIILPEIRRRAAKIRGVSVPAKNATA